MKTSEDNGPERRQSPGETNSWGKNNITSGARSASTSAGGGSIRPGGRSNNISQDMSDE
jgi:hypothetical protein